VSKSSEAVKKWRTSTKARIVKAMGEKCVCCDYNGCFDAMELHHLDSSVKEFGLGGVRANPRSWLIIVEELRKCVLLCCRCHREIHAGDRMLPDDFCSFDEKYLDYRILNVLEVNDICPVCGTDKPIHQITCSVDCARKIRHKIDWAKYDLIEMSKTMSNVAIGRALGCSDISVGKRIRRLKMISLVV
jgi:hypothetical protein